MSTADRAGDPPGWHGRPIEDLPWAVVVRVAVCWGVVCMIVTLLAAAFLPRPFGFIGTTIVTGSMMPNIQPGDVALVQPIDEYGLGQVILFPDPVDPDRRIIHRIVEVLPDGMLVTKGDANRTRDSAPVDPATVIGVGRILVPAIGLPIVWAANGSFILVILTVLLTALLLRGTLRIEFFPSTRKRAYVRALIESTAVVAMLGVAAVVIVVGAARSAHAAFIDRSETNGSWAMASAAPTPTPTPTPVPEGQCSIKDWRYETWGEPVGGYQGFARFRVWNNTAQEIPVKWVLTWDFMSDEIATGSPNASSVTQNGATVTFTAMDWVYLPPMSPSSTSIEVSVKSKSGIFLAPTNFVLNGTMPCTFVPVAADQLVTVIPPPAPTER